MPQMLSANAETLLRITPEKQERLDRIHRGTYCGNDNVLHGWRWICTRNIPCSIVMMLQKCIALIEEHIPASRGGRLDHDGVRRIAPGLLASGECVGEALPVLWWTDPKVTHLQLYWDTYVENEGALSFVNAIKPAIETIAPRFQEKIYPVEEERRLNSKVFIIPLRKQKDEILLRIYAKEISRVRWEIEYNKSLRTIFNREADTIGREVEDIAQLVQLAMDDATNRIRRFISALLAEKCMNTSTIFTISTFNSFISELVASCPDSVQRQRILETLFNNGRIIADASNRAMIERLEMRGVLRRIRPMVRSPRIYAFTNRYIALANALAVANPLLSLAPERSAAVS